MQFFGILHKTESFHSQTVFRYVTRTQSFVTSPKNVREEASRTLEHAGIFLYLQRSCQVGRNDTPPPPVCLQVATFPWVIGNGVLFHAPWSLTKPKRANVLITMLVVQRGKLPRTCLEPQDKFVPSLRAYMVLYFTQTQTVFKCYISQVYTYIVFFLGSWCSNVGQLVKESYCGQPLRSWRC